MQRSSKCNKSISLNGPRTCFPWTSLAKRSHLMARSIAELSNWPLVLHSYSVTRLTRGLGANNELVFNFRDGTRMITLRDPTVSYPIFEVLIEDCYELKRLRRLLPVAPVTIVDVGAHVGSASVALHRSFPEAKVISVEPSSDALGFLKHNLATNGVNGYVVEAAVGGLGGRGVLVQDRPCSWASHIETTLHDSTSTDRDSVSVLSMADLLASAGEGPILVKLDCEGCEYDILENSSGSSWDKVCALLMEYHPVPGREGWPWLMKQLSALGFAVMWHTPVGAGQGVACVVRQWQ